MELQSIKIGDYHIERLNEFFAGTSKVSIIRIFEFNGINYVSFVDDSDNALKTLDAKKFENQFQSFLKSLFMPEITPSENDSNCECGTCNI